MILTVDNITKQYKKFIHRYYEPRTHLRGLLEKMMKQPLAKNTEESFLALNKVSFSVKKGEVIGIIGANGSGKSTLLRIIAGITRPTSGTVHYEGRLAPLLSLTAGFHSEITGRENIFLAGALFGHKHKMIKKDIDYIIEFSGLANFIDTPLKFYSTGMVMRLGFSIATAPNLQNDIFLIDESLSVGDAEFKEKSLRRIQELQKHDKATFILVSHDMATVSLLCNKTLLLEKGRVKAYDLTEKVERLYQNNPHTTEKRFLA